MKVMQAYRFALDQTPGDERAFRSHAGASRFAWKLARRLENGTGRVPMKQEPGTAHAGKTGTASRQLLATRHVSTNAH